MADTLSKCFKTVLEMFKEVKEDVEEVRNILCEQNGNTNKEPKKTQKQKFSAEK